MSDALLRYGDAELTLPGTTGTEGETGVDISQLRNKLGLITLDRGFANTAEGAS